MQTVRTAPMIGLIAQLALLAALARTVGLSVIGWSIGILCALAVHAAVTHALARSRATTFGPANWVTLTRATLVVAVAAMIADSFVQPAPIAAMVMITIVALFLDAVDGKVARRTSTTTALGARFDMEVDAFLIFVLSAYVANSIGLWVLAIGAARYVLVGSGWLLPWLRETPPPRYWCKFVAALQGIVLTIAVADVLPHPATVGALMLALVLLAESFGREVWWLWQHGRIQTTRRTVEPRRIVIMPADVRPMVGVSE